MLDAVRTFILSRPWGREYELIYSNEHLLELTAAGATKGGMILRLASLLGVARKDIYCIGDHKNDIPMLEVSAVPFAPANAIPAVHEFGAHIVSHCSDGAVADVVEYLDKIYWKKGKAVRRTAFLFYRVEVIPLPAWPLRRRQAFSCASAEHCS